MGFNCHLHMDFQPLIDTFLLHKQVILSYIFAFLIASPASLRYWIAVQHATDVPAVVAPAAANVKKLSKWTIARNVALRLTITSAICYGIFQLPIGGVKVFTGFMTALPAFACMLSMSTTFRRNFPKFSVFRNPGGFPVQVLNKTGLTRGEKFGIFARIILAAAVSITAVLKFEASSILAATAVSFCVVRGSSTNFSTRIFYKLVAAFTAVCFVLTGAIVLLVLFYRKSDGGSSEKTENDSNLVALAEVLNEWTNWYLPAIHAFAPGALISACLRFDYQNYLDSLPEGSEAPVTLEVVPKPEPRVLRNGRTRRFVRRVVGETGVVIPTSIPRFAPIYFSVAFFLWAFAYGGMIYAEAYTSLYFKGNYEYSSCSVLVALPLMCVGMWVLALLRGEFKKFWTYQEKWNLPAKAPAAAPVVAAPTVEKAEVIEEKQEEVLVEV